MEFGDCVACHRIEGARFERRAKVEPALRVEFGGCGGCHSIRKSLLRLA